MICMCVCVCVSDCHQCVFTGRNPFTNWLIRIEPADMCFKACLKHHPEIMMQRDKDPCWKR